MTCSSTRPSDACTEVPIVSNLYFILHMIKTYQNDPSIVSHQITLHMLVHINMTTHQPSTRTTAKQGSSQCKQPQFFYCHMILIDRFDHIIISRQIVLYMFVRINTTCSSTLHNDCYKGGKF